MSDLRSQPCYLLRYLAGGVGHVTKRHPVHVHWHVVLAWGDARIHGHSRSRTWTKGTSYCDAACYMLESPCARVVLVNGDAIWNYSSSDNSPCD
jgi:hypothetical protein